MAVIGGVELVGKFGQLFACDRHHFTYRWVSVGAVSLHCRRVIRNRSGVVTLLKTRVAKVKECFHRGQAI